MIFYVISLALLIGGIALAVHINNMGIAQYGVKYGYMYNEGLFYLGVITATLGGISAISVSAVLIHLRASGAYKSFKGGTLSEMPRLNRRALAVMLIIVTGDIVIAIFSSFGLAIVIGLFLVCPVVSAYANTKTHTPVGTAIVCSVIFCIILSLMSSAGIKDNNLYNVYVNGALVAKNVKGLGNNFFTLILEMILFTLYSIVGAKVLTCCYCLGLKDKSPRDIFRDFQKK